MARRESTRSHAPELSDPTPQLREEIAELKARLQSLKGEAATNEVILRKTQERELELLKAESLPVLLRALESRLTDSYALDAVTLVLLDPQHEIRHLLIGSGDRMGIAWGYAFGAMLMLVAAALTPKLGLSAERRSLEDVAKPLSSAE